MMDLFEKIDMVAVEAMPKEEFCEMWGMTIAEHDARMLEIVHRQLERAGIRRAKEEEH